MLLHVLIVHSLLFLYVIPLYAYITNCSSTEGHLGHFQFGTIARDIKMKIHVPVLYGHML